MAGTFTVTINTSAGFGEKMHTENHVLADMLRQVTADVQAGRPSRAIVDRNGNSVGSYSYGAGMLNAGR